jgi:hypothetical protein
MTAKTCEALIQALQSQGFLLVADLPSYFKVVRQAKVMEFKP